MSFQQARREQIVVAGDINLHAYVLRGIPSSGKSTYIAEILSKHDITNTLKNRRRHVISNDDYSTRFQQIKTQAQIKSGHQPKMKNFLSMTDQQLDDPDLRTKYRQKYVFTLPNFRAIQNLIATKMEAGISPLIIDNTHTSDWEMIAPVILAEKYGYTLHIVEFDFRRISQPLYSAAYQKRKAQSGKDIPPIVLTNMRANMIKTMQKTDPLFALPPDQRGPNYRRRIRKTPIQEIPDFASFSQEVRQAWGRNPEYQRQANAHRNMGNVFGDEK
jgi:predicted kinase